MTNPVFTLIENTINNNPVVLFMKGNAEMPQCGFSATVVAILQRLKVAFIDVNILESEELRQGIKEYSDWPTIPQLYLQGEFVGGCDIVKELYHNGELLQILQSKNIEFTSDR